MCIWIFFTTLCETFLILRSGQGVFINIGRSSCKVPLFLSDFIKLEKLERFSKNITI